MNQLDALLAMQRRRTELAEVSLSSANANENKSRLDRDSSNSELQAYRMLSIKLRQDVFVQFQGKVMPRLELDKMKAEFMKITKQESMLIDRLEHAVAGLEACMKATEIATQELSKQRRRMEKYSEINRLVTTESVANFERVEEIDSEDLRKPIWVFNRR